MAEPDKIVEAQPKPTTQLDCTRDTGSETEKSPRVTANTRRPFYTEYAWAYDLVISRPLSRQCDFIVDRLSKRDVPPGAQLIDAGCGAGGHAIELARRGYIVKGIDAAPQLIAEARIRAADSGLAVSFSVGDILDLAFSDRHDGILCRGVLNDFLDDSDRQNVLISFARALRKGGTVILDVRDWDMTVESKTRAPVFERSVETQRGRLTFRSATRLDHQNRQLHSKERHTLTKDNVETCSTYDFKMRCWTQAELQRGLTQAGFTNIEYFGAYDLMVPIGASDRIVCVASLGH